MSEMMNYTTAAEFLGVKVATLYSMVSRREVPFTRIGRRLVRFSRVELTNWLASRTVKPREGGKAVV
jgi:excisionase family DNA binding protein